MKRARATAPGLDTLNYDTLLKIADLAGGVGLGALSASYARAAELRRADEYARYDSLVGEKIIRDGSTLDIKDIKRLGSLFFDWLNEQKDFQTIRRLQFYNIGVVEHFRVLNKFQEIQTILFSNVGMKSQVFLDSDVLVPLRGSLNKFLAKNSWLSMHPNLFDGCIKLRSVLITGSVTSGLADLTFNECLSLDAVSVCPRTMEHMPTFTSTTLRTLGITGLDHYTLRLADFDNKPNLESIIIEGDDLEVEDGAFGSLTRLEYLNIDVVPADPNRWGVRDECRVV